MKKRGLKKTWKKVWYFIWEDNSILSWIVNVILAFILIKFIVYPGLGFLLSTSHPVVAVVSGSMEHNGMGFDEWWDENKDWYLDNGIEKEEFREFSLKNGFNKGDIMVLVGKDSEDIETGDIIVFVSNRKDPIIHRVVKKMQDSGGNYFQTKGDNNEDSIRNNNLDETNVGEGQIIGKAVVRIPLLGYIKIWFVEILQFFEIVK